MSSFAVRSLAGLVVLAVVLPGCAKQGSGVPSKKEIPTLVDYLKNPDPKVRMEAVERLRLLGPDAAEALPALLAVWEDEDLTCRQWSSDAVGAIGEAAYPEIKQRLTAENPQIRSLAWNALVCLSPEIKGAHVEEINPLFAKGILDEDDRVRRRAAFAFMTYNSIAKDASTSVIDALKTGKDKWANDPSDKWIICYIVAGFQNYEKEHFELSRPLVPMLKELMNSRDEQVRGVSTGLLRQLGEIKLDDSNADPSKAPPGPRGPPPAKRG